MRSIGIPGPDAQIGPLAQAQKKVVGKGCFSEKNSSQYRGQVSEWGSKGTEAVGRKA